MTYKAGFIIVKYLLLKPIFHRFIILKTLLPPKRPRNVSKIPLPKSANDSLSRDRKRPESPCLRIPKTEASLKAHSARPTSAPPKREKLNDDFGSRLHNKAQEIEIKKQNIRKSLKVDYSFKPTLAENTKKWLNKGLRENKNSREEIAIVSSASILNFTKSPNSMNLVSPCISETTNQVPHKVKPVIILRGDRKFTDYDIKENYYN